MIDLFSKTDCFIAGRVSNAEKGGFGEISSREISVDGSVGIRYSQP